MAIEMTNSFYKKRFHNKGNLKLATEVLNGFNPDVFSRPDVTRIKCNMTENLELTSKLITLS